MTGWKCSKEEVKSLKKPEIAIVGGGPAGLSAALSAVRQGAQVMLIDRDPVLGGQLVKQTHMFFGSKKQYAAIRGIDIPQKLLAALQEEGNGKFDPRVNTTVLGCYDDGVLLLEKEDRAELIQPRKIIIATGAAEKMLPFPGNDLPGVYGAGAVQTLMNVYGIKPGTRVLMIGAGNIGLIVSYQLLQAGVEVTAIIEGAPKIGGYLVHATKVRRAGIPILTSHTIKEAYGCDSVEGAVLCNLDEKWCAVPGTEQSLAVDVICLAVGLTPQTELLWQAGCEQQYLPELGGYVPLRSEKMQTSLSHLFVAGDAACIEEAGSAMVEGKIAGLFAAADLGYAENVEALNETFSRELEELRSGPAGAKIRQGLSRLKGGAQVC